MVVIPSKQPTSKLWVTNQGTIAFKFISSDNKIYYYDETMKWQSQLRELSHDEYQSSLRKGTDVVYERGTWACKDLTELTGTDYSDFGVFDKHIGKFADFNGDLNNLLEFVNSQKDKYISEEPIRLAQEKKEAMRLEAIRVAKEKEAIQWVADMMARAKQSENSNNGYDPNYSGAPAKGRCSRCSGTGYLNCSSCNGTTEVACSSCRGNGINYYYHPPISCSVCGGRGRKPCQECSSYRKGRQKCSDCNGSGEIR
jgi:hypothetical protein